MSGAVRRPTRRRATDHASPSAHRQRERARAAKGESWPRRHSEARRRRGFATVMSLALALIFAGSLAVLTEHVAYDVRRTRAQADAAQRRQLLLAGAAAAESRLTELAGQPVGVSIDLPVPAALAASARLTLVRVEPTTTTPHTPRRRGNESAASPSDDAAAAPVTGEAIAVRVEAFAGERMESQTLQWRRANGDWRLAAITPP